MQTMTLTTKIDELSMQNRLKVAEAFQILAGAAVEPLTEEKQAVVNTAKELLLQIDVSITENVSN